MILISELMFECFNVRLDTFYAHMCSCVCVRACVGVCACACVCMRAWVCACVCTLGYLIHWKYVCSDTCVKYFFSVELAMTENLRGLSDKYETLENTLGMFVA